MAHNIFGQPQFGGVWIQPAPVTPVVPMWSVQPPQPVVNIIQAPQPNLADAFKPTKAGKETAHVVFVLDRSSSMRSIQDRTISGYNEYLAGQKADALATGIKTLASLYTFDGPNVTAVFELMDIHSVPDLTRETYNPNGYSTNLLDAIGGVLMQVNTRLTQLKKAQRWSVIMAILTDGQENSSHVFNNAAIKTMVGKAEKANWGFMFMGANIDAFAVGSTLGMRVENTIQFTAGNVAESMVAATRMTNSMKAAYASGADSAMAYNLSAFTDEERTRSIGGLSNV